MRIHNTGQEILVADSNSHNYPKSANSRLGECKSLEIPIPPHDPLPNILSLFSSNMVLNLCFVFLVQDTIAAVIPTETYKVMQQRFKEFSTVGETI